MERVAFDIRSLYAQSKVGIVGEANDSVTISLRRHAVDEIDKAVFHPSRLQAVDQVGDEGPTPSGRGDFDSVGLRGA
jgi:hypothetical protein